MDGIRSAAKTWRLDGSVEAMLKAGTHVATCIVLSLCPLGCGRDNYDAPLRDAAGVPRDANLDAASEDAFVMDGDMDASADAPEDARSSLACSLPGCRDIDPSLNACAMAEEGPFVERARFDMFGDAYGVWLHAPDVLAADSGGLSSMTFDGTRFSLITRVGTGWTEAIWNRGDDFFVAAPGTGLYAFRIAESGAAVELTRDLTRASEARRGWADSRYVYVPNGGGGLLAYTLLGGALTPVGTAMPTTGWSQGVWTDGTHIFFADNANFRVVRFDGTTFIELASVPLAGASRVWGGGPGGVIYVAHAGGVTAYTFEDRLRSLALFVTASPARDVWSDGAHVFVAAEADGVYALRFASEIFTEVGHIDTDGVSLGVVSDGTYLYVGDGAAGIKAYSGFRCLMRR